MLSRDTTTTAPKIFSVWGENNLLISFYGKKKCYKNARPVANTKEKKLQSEPV